MSLRGSFRICKLLPVRRSVVGAPPPLPALARNKIRTRNDLPGDNAPTTLRLPTLPVIDDEFTHIAQTQCWIVSPPYLSYSNSITQRNFSYCYWYIHRYHKEGYIRKLDLFMILYFIWSMAAFITSVVGLPRKRFQTNHSEVSITKCNAFNLFNCKKREV